MFKITVGICCYKQGEWLHRCLRSLSDQTIDKSLFEVVIVNDDPAERLDCICETFEEHLNIRIINNPSNIGLPGSLNKILKSALGKYFVRVDCDDYVSRDFLYMLSTFLEQNLAASPKADNIDTDYQAVACDYFKVSKTGTVISRHNWEHEPVACGIMFTYESLCNVGFYDENFKMREGHNLLQRYKEDGYMLYNLPVPLYKYRVHDTNRTKNKKEVEKYDKKLLKG